MAVGPTKERCQFLKKKRSLRKRQRFLPVSYENKKAPQSGMSSPHPRRLLVYVDDTTLAAYRQQIRGPYNVSLWSMAGGRTVSEYVRREPKEQQQPGARVLNF